MHRLNDPLRSYRFEVTYQSHWDGCTNTTALFIFIVITSQPSRRLHRSMYDIHCHVHNRTPHLCHYRPACLLAYQKGTYWPAVENSHAISPSPSSSSASPSRSTISPSPSVPSTPSISPSAPCTTAPCWFLRPRLLGPGPAPGPGTTCVGMEAAVSIPGGMRVSTPAAFCALITGQ